MLLATIMPVAAAVTKPLERPAPSPATYNLGIGVSRFLLVSILFAENFTSGA